MDKATVFPKYESYRDSGFDWLGDIPSDWKLQRLATVFEERKEKVSDKDFPPLSVTKNGVVPQLESAAKSDDGDNRKGVREGDFVINSRSDRKGSSGIAKQDGSVSLINIVLKPKGIVHRYSEHLLKSNGFIEEFYRNGHGIVADLWTTRYWDMKSIHIPLPDMATQDRIANFLNQKTVEIDEAIVKKQRLIELLNEQKNILINQAVTKGLNPNAPLRDSGFEWIGKVPSHWNVKRLRFVGTTQNGISAGAEYFGSGFPFVSYSDVYNNRELPKEVKGLAKSSEHDRVQYSIENGDVLFTRTSETVEEIGFASTCMETIKNSTFAGFLIRFRPLNGYLIPGYSKYYFSAQVHRSYFVGKMNLVIRASLSQELLKNLPVLIPPKVEQKLIFEHIETESVKYDKSIALQQQQIDTLKEFKATLISEAVTGKIKL
ncbi:MAG: restriction endonuclease subunit S [Oryzomonas sp.]|uniref:restriction endonuclease subunit S n=1 Tax=Oryzomonas sp. TaxID=2855186 RepID=UPI0028453E32|nr:restriction endonuclease subunit S [Oryzomonas sp.]MDR3581308.1 restriction endonuclease subunit S [Oryzomonas sp.]